MPLDYLRSIAQETFPLRVDDEHNLRCVEVLRAASLITAEIFEGDMVHEFAFAIVRGITHEGRAALERDAVNKPLA
jgi:hypothetical protein